MKNTADRLLGEIAAGYGPSPALAGDDLTDPQIRCLTALYDGSFGVTEVAEQVELQPNMTRRHLRVLARRGLIAESTKQSGRGRPAAEYNLTAAGRSALAGQVGELGDDYQTLATAFTTHLATHSSNAAEDARRIGRAWGAELATGSRPRSGARRRTALIELLTRLGFSPAERDSGDVTLRTCPLLAAARAHPEVTCQVHLGMVQGAAETFGGAVDDGRIDPFAEPGACVLHLPG